MVRKKRDSVCLNHFIEAVKQVQLPGDNVVMERRWKDFGNRYGELDQVGLTIVEEILASYSNERLRTLVELVKNPQSHSLVIQEAKGLLRFLI